MTPSIADIDRAEAANLDAKAAPVLAGSMTRLRQRWAAGCRDRETGLRLLFLCWYANIEPPFLTGLQPLADGPALCREAFEALGGVETRDAETRYVVGVMTELASWCLGEEAYWEVVGERMRGSQDQPASLQFAGRGAYGEYFRHMVGAHPAGPG